MSEATDIELQAIKQQLALLRQENAATRTGWMKWLRATGLLLLGYAGAISYGVLKAHGNVESNPIVSVFVFGALFMGCFGLWCFAWSFRLLADRLMKTA